MKKILFSDKYLLTDAVICGKKTNTRRIIANKNITRKKARPVWLYDWLDEADEGDIRSFISEHAPYRVGERLAVAQCYRDLEYPQEYASLAGWGNKMFVRAEDMPWAIELAHIGVERLQSISAEDCLKEGVIQLGPEEFTVPCSGVKFVDPRQAFRYLFGKVHDRGGTWIWMTNPYCWVLDWKLVKM